MAKEVIVLSVTRQNEPFVRDWQEFYLKRLKSPPVKLVEIKPKKQSFEEEQELILEKLESWEKERSLSIVTLDERGKQFPSIEFSQFLGKLLDSTPGQIVFIIGGAYGLGEAVKKKQQASISLSSMTFPHKLAKILLLEQLYRSQCIASNHPYHHA